MVNFDSEQQTGKMHIFNKMIKFSAKVHGKSTNAPLFRDDRGPWESGIADEELQTQTFGKPG